MDPDQPWEAVSTAGKPKAEGFDRRSGWVLLSFPLSITPPDHWKSYFDVRAEEATEQIARSEGLDTARVARFRPLVMFDSIQVWSKPSPEEFDKWRAWVDRMIQEANRAEEDSRRSAAEVQEIMAERARQARPALEQAQRWIDELWAEDKPEPA